MDLDKQMVDLPVLGVGMELAKEAYGFTYQLHRTTLAEFTILNSH